MTKGTPKNSAKTDKAHSIKTAAASIITGWSPSLTQTAKNLVAYTPTKIKPRASLTARSVPRW